MDPPQPPTTSTPAPSGSSSTPVTDSPPKYVPQFSATTEMILRRINSGTSTTLGMGPIVNTGMLPGYDDMRRAVMSNMRTSMNMELSSTPQSTGRRNQGGRASVGSASSAGATKTAGTPTRQGSAQKNSKSTKAGKRSGAGKGKAGTKRKRGKETSEESSAPPSEMSLLGDESETDDSASVTEDFPKVTSSGRAINKPAQFVPAVSETPPKKRAPSKKSVENALCKRCGRGHSPASNMIVFCDGCNLGWHQNCHDPAVSAEAVKDESAAWFCADCTLKRENKRGAKKATPPEPPKLVSWQGRSNAEKRAYFSSLPHPHLVHLLLQAITLRPDLPIFPAVVGKPPMQAYLPPQPPQPSRINSLANTSAAFTKATRHSHARPETPFPPSAVTGSGLFSRADTNPNATMNFIRKVAPGEQRATPSSNASSPSTMQPPSFIKTSSAPPTLPPQSGLNVIGGGDGADDSRESTPASPPYPKAGNGLMAKLGPDDQDMEWLVDENDFGAFSHIIYDEHAARGSTMGITSSMNTN